MQRVTLDRLPVTATTRKTLEASPGVAGALVSDDPDVGAISVTVFGPGLSLPSLEEARKADPGAAWVWERGWKPPKRKPKPRSDGLTRTAAALKLIDEEDLRPYTAAQQCGVDVAAVYRALARREAKAKAPKCPCCQRPLPAEAACAS